MVVDQPVRAELAAGLLVGEEAQHDVARRLAALAAPSGGRAASIIASMSFMSTAPRPQTQSSAISPANGSWVQSRGLGGHDVEVAVDEQRRAAGVLALPPHDEAGPPVGRLEDRRAPDRPRRASRRRTRPPPAPPARCRRRSWTSRSGSGRGRGRRPRPAALGTVRGSGTVPPAGCAARLARAAAGAGHPAPPARGRAAGERPPSVC